MARQYLLVLACFFVLNVSLVLSREDYYQHFSNVFSHHHRRSTPEDDDVSTEIPVTVSRGMPHSDASGITINFAKKTTGERVEVIQNDSSYYYRQEADDIAKARIIGGVISLVLFVIGLIIIFCCGKKIGRKVTTGHIVNK